MTWAAICEERGLLVKARSSTEPPSAASPTPHQRRSRYRGTHPRYFSQKYKELNPGEHHETVAHVLAAGKTPAGSHRPIMTAEILLVLAPKPGETAADLTLGWGGHSRELLASLMPGGRLLGLDVDPRELPKTEARLRALGYDGEAFCAQRANFAGLPEILLGAGMMGADCILADLGVSSMQLDDPQRGFTAKVKGPLDMRMNPQKGRSAAVFLQTISVADLAALLLNNADEPGATRLAQVLAGQSFATTIALATAIRAAQTYLGEEAQDLSVRRVFQALRIAVNEEFEALETLLRRLPECLNPGGRVAILTFHSGEDRRVKKAFEAGLRDGVYAAIAPNVIRAGADERHSNPRSSCAKLRWARRIGGRA